MIEQPNDHAEFELRDAAPLSDALGTLVSSIGATVDAPAAAPVVVDLLDTLAVRASTAPLLDHDASDSSWSVRLADGLTSIVGPEMSVDIVEIDDLRSATVALDDLLCIVLRAPASATAGPLASIVPGVDAGASGDGDAERVTVQIIRAGETVVDVVIGDGGHIVDQRDVEGLTAAWTELYERELSEALRADEACVGETDEDDAELTAASERIRARAEQRRQEAAEREAAEREPAERDTAEPEPVAGLAPPVPTWVATHVVPDGGMSVWPAPDPALERDPAGPLVAATVVRVHQRRGDWAEIVTQEGRVGWVDARRLIELAHPPI